MPDEQQGKSTFTLPGDELTLSPVPGRSFPMPHRDFRRFMRRAAALKDPAPWQLAISLVSFGIAPGAFLAFVGWLPVYSQLSQQSQNSFNWVGPLLLVSAVAATVIAVGFLVAHVSLRKKVKHDATVLCEDMDSLYEPFKAAGDVAAQSGQLITK
jgi:hypothetical protein